MRHFEAIYEPCLIGEEYGYTIVIKELHGMTQALEHGDVPLMAHDYIQLKFDLGNDDYILSCGASEER